MQREEVLKPSKYIFREYLERNIHIEAKKNLFRLVEKDIEFEIYEMEPQKDGADLLVNDWKVLIEIIRESDFDGYVILHGVETLIYTAAALSFAINSKPVVLTGSMLPIYYKSTDAFRNFAGALSLACQSSSRVNIFFNNNILSPVRTVITHTCSFDAFEQVAKKGKITGEVMFPNLNFSEKIRVVKIHPGIDDLFFAQINNENTDALIMETLGSGTIPLNGIFYEIKRILELGVMIVIVKQSTRGRITDFYQSTRILKELGVVFGNDIIAEVAFSKLSLLFGISGDHEFIKDVFLKNLRGEIGDTNL